MEAFFVLLLVVSVFIVFFILPNRKKTKPKEEQKQKRRYVKDVKPGEYIQVEWTRMKEGIGLMKCLNNDPDTKKILLEIRWGNYKEVPGTSEYEKAVFDYDGKELANFNLLNQLPLPSHPKSKEEPPKESEDYDIATLQKQMNAALEKEEYEKANELQKKIDKLLKK